MRVVLIYKFYILCRFRESSYGGGGAGAYGGGGHTSGWHESDEFGGDDMDVDTIRQHQKNLVRGENVFIGSVLFLQIYYAFFGANRFQQTEFQTTLLSEICMYVCMYEY